MMITIYQKVSELLIQQGVRADEIELKASLTKDLGFNSLDIAELIVLCETTFHVELPDSDIRHFVKIEDVVLAIYNALSPPCKTLT